MMASLAINPLQILADRYLWEYHESPIYTAFKWIGYVVMYGGIALAVCGGIWKSIKSSSDEPSSGKPTSLPLGEQDNARARNSVVSSDSDNSGGTPHQSPCPAGVHGSVPVPSVTQPASPRPGTGGSDVPERLQRLNDLHEKGLVSAAIYEAKRREILQDV